jgi:UDP-N-acetylglucosamine 2-epimerase (non-hydrolysing)
VNARRVLSFFGTRPEAIKMAPVVRAFADHPGMVHRVCNTGQHRDLVAPLLDWFGIPPNVSLDLMTANQSLAGFTASCLTAIDALLDRESPDLVLCQGDTTTAMVVGLAAFYRRIPVGHIEAGLRTYDCFSPFPEEFNRRVIDLVADHCFAPTERAAAQLRAEGVAANRVQVTGNTSVDALQWTLRKLDSRGTPPEGVPRELLDYVRMGIPWNVVTAHRRESFGTGMHDIASAVRSLAEDFPRMAWVLPVHPNPNVREIMYQRLEGIRNVLLTPPLTYPQFCWTVARSSLVLTDSGGVQEECPSLGIPVFVMRETSERPEGIAAGNVCLVGTDTERIRAGVHRYFSDAMLRDEMSTPRTVYGDGRAGERIAEYCAEILNIALTPELERSLG